MSPSKEKAQDIEEHITIDGGKGQLHKSQSEGSCTWELRGKQGRKGVNASPTCSSPLVYLPRTQQSTQHIVNANKIELSECNDKGPLMNHWSEKLRLDVTFKVTRSHPSQPCSMLFKHFQKLYKERNVHTVPIMY